MCFFCLRHISHLDETITSSQRATSNEISVVDIDGASSNTKNGTSPRNSNIIDLLTFFTKCPFPDTWSQPLTLSLEDE